MKIDMKDFNDFILDDKNILELFNMFKNSKTENWYYYDTLYPHSLYNELVKCRDFNKKVKIINNQEKFEFELMCFNKWKNSIIKFDSNKVNPKYRNGFIKYKNILESYNPKSVKDISKLVDERSYKDQEICNFVKTFSYGEYKGSVDNTWTNISSGTLAFPRKNAKGYEVKGRFYLNIDSNYIHKFAKEYMKKCEENDIPYIFKYDEDAKRKDSMVFYTNYELMEKHLTILKEIRNENNDIKNSIHKPPLLTSKLDNWLGYGAEPNENFDIEVSGKIYGYPKSFNTIRSLIIYVSFMSIGKDSIKQACINDKNYKNELLIEIIYKSMNKTFKDYNEALNYYKNNFDSLLENIAYLGTNSLVYSKEKLFAEIIKEHMCKFLENDKDLINKFKTEYGKNCEKRNISSENSAFNKEDEKMFDIHNSENKNIKSENYSSIVDTINNYALSESGEFIDKRTDSIVKDEKLKYKIIFSKCWENVVEANGYLSVNPLDGNIFINNEASKTNSMVYNPEVKKIYDVFMASCIYQIKEKGYIEPLEVLACVDSFDINCYLKDDLVISLFSRYDTARVIDTYARSFVSNSKTNSNMYKTIDKYGTELENYYFNKKK